MIKAGTTGGYFQTTRNTHQLAVFESVIFTPYEAYLWLCEHAASQAKNVSLCGKIIPLNAGQYATTINRLMAAFGWRHHQLMRYLKRLHNAHLITIQESWMGASQMMVITICHYQHTPRNQVVKMSDAMQEIPEILTDNWQEHPLPPANIIEMWNEYFKMPNMADIRLTVTRNYAIQRASNTLLPTGKEWLHYLNCLRQDYFTNGTATGWRINIDWALKPDNILKMLEGGIQPPALQHAPR